MKRINRWVGYVAAAIIALFVLYHTNSGGWTVAALAVGFIFSSDNFS
ncbi:MAG: hypothetical protein HFJ60_07080 [Clostridia bacterium]|jgi:hypothetical protein|nr:hypothetical protein [Clostridia bacterium]